LQKAGVEPMQLLREMRMDDVAGFKVGMELKADLFKVGEQVRVTGVTKGKGFQGVMKRWGFRGGPTATAGALTGARLDRPVRLSGRVWKNKRMAATRARRG